MKKVKFNQVHYLIVGLYMIIIGLITIFSNHYIYEHHKLAFNITIFILCLILFYLLNKLIIIPLRKEQKEQERIKDFAKCSADWFWETDTKGRYTFISDGIKKIEGYSPRELLGKYIFEVTEENITDTTVSSLNQMELFIKDNKDFKNIVFKRKAKNGEILHILTNGTPFFDKNGNLLGYRGVDKNITKDKETELALEKSQKELSDIINNTDAVIYVKDLKGRFLLINEQFEKLFNISNEDIKGKTDYDIFPKESAEFFRKNDQEAINKNKLIRSEEIVPQSDGIHYYLSIKYPLTESNGDIYGMCGVSTDITERKNAELALKERMKELSCLFNLSEIIEKNKDNIDKMLSYCVESFRNGWQSPESISSKIIFEENEYFSDNYKDGVVELTKKIIVNNKDVGKIIVNYNESKEFLEEEIQLLSAIADKISYTIEKIETNKIIEGTKKQLFKAEKLAILGTLSAGIAHEINNPNTYIGMNVSMLKEMWEETEEKLNNNNIDCKDITEQVPTLLEGINEGSKRIENIVASLKNYCRQKTNSNKESINLNELIEKNLLIINNLISKSTHRFNVKYCDDLPNVLGDSQTISQVIINLISNACEALEDMDSSIEVITKVDTKENEVILEINDEGIGMEDRALKHIFDPFFTMKQASGGTGLGLSIVEKIVRDNNGIINISSKSNIGTKVTVKFPIKV